MKNIAEILDGVKTMGIGGHVRPDGDCVGSCMALYLYVKTYWPEIQVDVYLDHPKPVFGHIDCMDEVKMELDGEKEYDLFVTCDVSAKDRLAIAAPYFDSAKKTACIDHHVSNPGFAQINHIRGEVSSACEVLYSLLDPEKINCTIAKPIYTGMVHDTGVFQDSCTSKKTMDIAGSLMEMGIDYPKIIDETFYTKTFSQNKILGQALIKSELYLDGDVIFTWISLDEMRKYDVLPKHLDGIVNQLRITKDIKIAVFLYENEDGTYKGSLRVNGDYDVSAIASIFGGGGHVKAAGFTIDGPVDIARDRIIGAIKENIRGNG